MTTKSNTSAKLHKMGTTGAISLGLQIGRVTRDERRAIMAEHAAKVTAMLPVGVMVDRSGQVFQVAGGTVGFSEVDEMIRAASKAVAA